MRAAVLHRDGQTVTFMRLVDRVVGLSGSSLLPDGHPEQHLLRQNRVGTLPGSTQPAKRRRVRERLWVRGVRASSGINDGVGEIPV